jgi:DNA-binding PadR family transcriptional regulator
MKSPINTEPTASVCQAGALPLSTLLSQVLVAFTIEFDNEFEHQMPHRITASTSATHSNFGPWLVSMVMFSNFLQFVDEDGVTVEELQRRARTANLSLAGMERWGYVSVGVGPGDSRPNPPLRRRVVRPTVKGRRAQQVWLPLFKLIEECWRSRFSHSKIDRLRESLMELVAQFDVELPDYLPVLGYGMIAQVPHLKKEVHAANDANAPRPNLPTLLSKALLAFALDFERESVLSLVIGANLLRVMNEEGVRVYDLPRLSGVSKEAIKGSLGFLEKRRYAVVEATPRTQVSGKKTIGVKVVRLTAKGREAQDAYRQRLTVVEKSWQVRYGKDIIHNLCESLEALVSKHAAGEIEAESSLLFLGLEPYPDGWRASVPKPATLPHYPMVLHRGGYPDGS